MNQIPCPIDLAIFDEFPINVVVYKATEGGEGFVFSYLNKSVERTEKIRKEDIIGKQLGDCFPIVKEIGFLEALKRVYRSGVSEVLEPFFYQDERIFGWRRNQIFQLPDEHLLVVYEDFSAKKNLEKKMAALGKIINSSVNEIYMFEPESLKFTYANESALGNIGYSLDELLTIEAVDIKPNYTKYEFSELIHPLVADEVSEVVYETIHQRKDGSTYPVEVRMQKMEIDNKLHIVTIVLNTQERGMLQERLEQRNALYKKLVNEMDVTIQTQSAAMLEQSRLAQMGEMLSMIAHQWRQPLASISAIASTLEVDVMMDEYKKDFFAERLHSIADLSQHLSLTINDFRDFFKKDKLTATVTWEQLVDSTFKIIAVSLSAKKITVQSLLEETSPFETYPNEIRQVLLNLYKNAEDVLVEKRADGRVIRVRNYQKGYFTCLSIEDNGGGIPPCVIEKIFDPYFSTKTQKDGTGLGLYMSKIIIETHCKGTLKVSNTSEGAMFEICLPLTKENE